jgi:hypothetical protein
LVEKIVIYVSAIYSNWAENVVVHTLVIHPKHVAAVVLPPVYAATMCAIVRPAVITAMLCAKTDFSVLIKGAIIHVETPIR